MCINFWQRLGVALVSCCVAVALPAVMGEYKISAYAFWALCIGILCTRLFPRAGDAADFVETVFTPDESGLQAYLRFLDRAQRTVHVAFFAMTSEPILRKLIELRGRGVHVYIALDKRTASTTDPLSHTQRRLRMAKINIFVVSSTKGQAMHHKFAVVDDTWTFDGSWNGSAGADKQSNHLNFVCSKRRAQEFLSQWQKLTQAKEKSNVPTTVYN